eukprot:scaffold259919_cov31-Tisochrysis_lutea.AAC.1
MSCGWSPSCVDRIWSSSSYAARVSLERGLYESTSSRRLRAHLPLLLRLWLSVHHAVAEAEGAQVVFEGLGLAGRLIGARPVVIRRQHEVRVSAVLILAVALHLLRHGDGGGGEESCAVEAQADARCTPHRDKKLKCSDVRMRVRRVMELVGEGMRRVGDESTLRGWRTEEFLMVSCGTRRGVAGGPLSSLSLCSSLGAPSLYLPAWASGERFDSRIKAEV